MKNKTSVLIVNSNEKIGRTFQVPTHIIRHWKKYVVFIPMIIILFIVGSCFLIHQNTSHFYLEKLEKSEFVRKQIDLHKALTAFANIDSGMYRINSFLEERGLEKLKMSNVGGMGIDFDIRYINEFADFYQNQVLDLEETLNSVPIGLPFDGKIVSEFGYRRNPFNGRSIEFHTGIDFRGVSGDSIRTMGTGIVSFSGYNGGYGKCVIIDHGNNLQTLYGHLRQINVTKGELVNNGQLIGLMGSTGRSTGPHLHYEIIRDGKKINPEKYVKVMEEKEKYG